MDEKPRPALRQLPHFGGLASSGYISSNRVAGACLALPELRDPASAVVHRRIAPLAGVDSQSLEILRKSGKIQLPFPGLLPVPPGTSTLYRLAVSKLVSELDSAPYHLERTKLPCLIGVAARIFSDKKVDFVHHIYFTVAILKPGQTIGILNSR